MQPEAKVERSARLFCEEPVRALWRRMKNSTNLVEVPESRHEVETGFVELTDSIRFVTGHRFRDPLRDVIRNRASLQRCRPAATDLRAFRRCGRAQRLKPRSQEDDSCGTPEGVP